MLTKKLLHQWKGNEDVFWHDKMVILFQLRKFNEGNVSFRDMILKGEGIDIDDFEKVLNFIFSNQKKTVLIFDGLDELTVDSELLNTGVTGISSPNEKVPAFLLLKKLVNGEMLRGLTILVTSRSTAKDVFRVLHFTRTVEILGFFEEQIKDYVCKFCKHDMDTAKKVWDHIKTSGELLSLCYVPVNSYIVCLTLKESITNEETFDVPKTLTELYKRAVKVLIYRHHPRYKSKLPPSDYLFECFPREIEADLSWLYIKEVAKDGIEKGELIFKRASESNFQDLANCGFFYKLPDKGRNYFCFLHLTLQEFFAALSVVDDMDHIDQFLAKGIEDPKWHLVIQFVAGLIGDKIKQSGGNSKEGETNDPKEYKNENIAAFVQRYYTYMCIKYDFVAPSSMYKIL